MTATNGKGRSETKSGQSVGTRLLGFIGSVRLAIFVLSFVAVTSILGTLIKQQASAEEYLSRYSVSAYGIIHAIGLDDVFHSWWFLLSLIVFALNLVVCTVARMKILLKSQSRHNLPKEPALKDHQLSFARKGISVEEASHLLKGYKTTAINREGAILEKGRIAQYGVLFIHGSILLILLGSLIGLHFGYRGSLSLSVGESKDTVTLRDYQAEPVPLGFTVKCADFKVAFYQNGQPKEFVSSLEVIEDGRVVAKKDIRVNDPLTYKGISLYQASYGDTVVSQFSINGKNVELSEGSTYRQGELLLMFVRYAESVHNFGPGVQLAYLENGEPKSVWFLRDVARLKEQVILGIPLRLQGIKQERYTGLEVTKDPGLWFVWSGFFFMLCGLYINFGLYHRRIYLLPRDDGVLVAGMSRKNREGFSREFQRVKERLNAER